MEPSAVSARVRFGDFEVDLASGELRRDGARVKLQEQPFQVLAALVERPGDILSREDLRNRLWPPDVVVDFERGLNKAINRLREALGDNPENPQFIETVPQRGYRFLAEVERADVEAAKVKSVAYPQQEAALKSTQPITGATLMNRRRLFAVAGGVSAIPLLALAYRRLASGPTRIQSIAVLPLENLSKDINQEYFSDGMTDQLIGEIARIGSLRVISRTSIMQYKGGARKPLPTIARELNVDAILEGTVLHSGSRVRITAQLIRADDDRHIWAEEYERDLTDVLALQGEVARAIAGQIKIQLTPLERKHLTRARSIVPEAYDRFLQGNFFLQQGAKGIARSMDLFQRAIELDPLQAESHAGLAEALCYAAIYGLRPCAQAYPAAREAALRALKLDESNGPAHDALADVMQGYDRNPAGARTEFVRALELTPTDPIVRARCAENLTRLGKFDQAIQVSNTTLELDPASAISYSSRAMIFFRSRRYDEAIQASQQALEFDPLYVQALWWQGVSYAAKGDFSKSLPSLAKALSIADGPLFRGYLGFAYGRAGEKDKSLKLLEDLTTMSGQRWVSPIDYALIYAGLGDADSTFAWLEKAFQAHETRFELASFYYDVFRPDPRFANLTSRLGIPFPVATSN